MTQKKQFKVVVDRAIPFLEGVLDPWFEVVRKGGREITAEDVADADALIVRTRTQCDERLLARSHVRFIATATIGFDHIDLDYCCRRGIEVATAAGCNARGVLQWVGGVLALLARHGGWHPVQRTLGVVGVGHVGSLVKAYAEQWGFRVLCCDPPREEREHLGFLSLEEVAREADILTFHTPLDKTTYHLCNAELLHILPAGAVVLNASRGEVADQEALLASSHPFALDVWEHEPHLHPELLARARVATPHIAGYSLQGKANATALAVRALARHFELPLTSWYPASVTPTSERAISWEELCRTIPRYFDAEAESESLRRNPDCFEQLRDNYAYREEYF